jgi:pimeloyl-ACP methyl ester carboxylesterase
VNLPDGAVLAFQEGGPSGAPGLLLLQGQANSHHWWDGLREAFEDRFRTLTFDYRGTGASVADEGAAPWSTSSFAGDAAAVLAEAGHERVHVYGTSMGGRVAQMLAIEHPDRVDRLVLACTAAGGPTSVERSLEVRRSLMDPDLAARLRALLELMYTPAWFARPRRSRLLGDPGMSPAATRLHLRVSARHDAYQRLPEIASTVLVLHGTADRMAPVANASLLAGQLRDASVRLTEGGRHGFFDEFAADVSPVVTEFLLHGES